MTGARFESGRPRGGPRPRSYAIQQASVYRPDPLQNPLRAALLRFTCSNCGFYDPPTSAKGPATMCHKEKFLCSRCAVGKNPGDRYAYVSLIYGKGAEYVSGALVLGYSLRATGSSLPRILMHTDDVPREALVLLAELWDLRRVEYIWSAEDLHNQPYEEARFKQVFTKLHCFNPAVLPYDRVLFVDLDMLVLRNLEELFKIRPPAAMSNTKKCQRDSSSGKVVGGPRGVELAHGARMGNGVDDNYFNAGTMLLAPSQPLFDLLVADVLAPDPTWHLGGWSPEQKYLSRVYAGAWSHISQLFNFEVQLHSGVPLTPLWEEAEATDIAVCHFSGSPKVWSHHPASEEDTLLTSHWVQDIWKDMPAAVQQRSQARYRLLSAEWHRTLAAAFRFCQGNVSTQAIGAWDFSLQSGLLPSIHSGSSAQNALPLPVSVGQVISFEEEEGIVKRGEVVRVESHASQPSIVVWSVPLPGQRLSGVGSFGLCQRIQAISNRAALKSFPLGDKAAAWTGEGHSLGVVEAANGDDRLLQFGKYAPPRWMSVADLRPVAEEDQELQCAECLQWVSQGRFDQGLWICQQCSQRN